MSEASMRSGGGACLLTLVVLALALPGLATAAVGDITYRGCISTDSTNTGCESTTDATPAGTDSGMDVVLDAAVSPDGRNLYAAAFFGDSLSTFTRDPATGALSYQGCITSNSSLTACAKLPGAAAGGANTALDTLRTVTVSPDGTSVYVTGSADAVVHFSRSTATGAVSFVSCLTSNTSTAGCTPIPGATAGGAQTPLENGHSLAVSADGSSLYASSSGADALTRFDRSPATGAITFQGCLTSNSDAAGCTPIPGAAAMGTNTPLDEVRGVVVSPEGRSVFAVSRSGDALTRFGRDTSSGAITFQGCVGSDSNVAGCTLIPASSAGGESRGLNALDAVAISPDGKSLYTGGNTGVAHLARDPNTGVITYIGCISSETTAVGCTLTPNAVAPLAQAGTSDIAGVVVSPDGENVYTASGVGSAVATFGRDPATSSGALTFEECVTGASNVAGCRQIAGTTQDGSNTGLDSPRSITISPDGASLYVAAQVASAVATLDRELAPAPRRRQTSSRSAS